MLLNNIYSFKNILEVFLFCYFNSIFFYICYNFIERDRNYKLLNYALYNLFLIINKIKNYIIIFLL